MQLTCVIMCVALAVSCVYPDETLNWTLLILAVIWTFIRALGLYIEQVIDEERGMKDKEKI